MGKMSNDGMKKGNPDIQTLFIQKNPSKQTLIHIINLLPSFDFLFNHLTILYLLIFQITV
jgi:hypothetical protein